MLIDYRARQDDRDEAVRLRRLMPTFEHIPELVAPVTCQCRGIVAALRDGTKRRAIVWQHLPTGDSVPVIAEVDQEFGFEKAILWLAGGAAKELLNDVERQSAGQIKPDEFLLPLTWLRDHGAYVLRHEKARRSDAAGPISLTVIGVPACTVTES